MAMGLGHRLEPTTRPKTCQRRHARSDASHHCQSSTRLTDHIMGKISQTEAPTPCCSLSSTGGHGTFCQISTLLPMVHWQWLLSVIVSVHFTVMSRLKPTCCQNKVRLGWPGVGTQSCCLFFVQAFLSIQISGSSFMICPLHSVVPRRVPPTWQ